jgi:hypothetical protein
MELLILPTSAQRLWKRTAAVLDKALSMMGNPPSEWTIGGGTILAQRWAHRDSTDIDLTVPEGSLIQALGERLGGTLRKDMYAIGAQHVSIGKTRHQIVFRDGAIDIAEMDSRPRHGHQTALLDGRHVRVKSSTQILRGKLERAQRKESPARDLFDIAVAAQAAPSALSAAANMLDPESIRAITAEWTVSAHRLNQEAGAKLQNISPEYAAEKRDLTQRAVARLKGALYQEYRIETEQGTARFSAVAHDFAKHVVTADEGNLREVANAHGIDEFIAMHAVGGAASILDEVARRLAARAPRTTILQWSATRAGIAYPTGERTTGGGVPDRSNPPGIARTTGPAREPQEPAYQKDGYTR